MITTGLFREEGRELLVLVYCTNLSGHVFRFIHCRVSGVSNQLLWKIIKKQGKLGSCARVFTRQTVSRIAYSLQRMHSQMLTHCSVIDQKREWKLSKKWAVFGSKTLRGNLCNGTQEHALSESTVLEIIMLIPLVYISQRYPQISTPPYLLTWFS